MIFNKFRDNESVLRVSLRNPVYGNCVRDRSTCEAVLKRSIGETKQAKE